MIAKARYVASACVITVTTAYAQSPTLQDLQTKLLEFEESTQRTIQDLKAQIATAIQPLLQAKYIDVGQVKDVYRASDKSYAAKKSAKDSLKAIQDKYNARIYHILSPEQSKEWKRMQKDWKDDLSVPKI